MTRRPENPAGESGGNKIETKEFEGLP